MRVQIIVTKYDEYFPSKEYVYHAVEKSKRNAIKNSIRCIEK